MKTAAITVSAAVLLAVACTDGASVRWTQTVGHPVWKGERVHAEALISAQADLNGVRVDIEGDDYADARFVFDVMGDVFADRFDQSGPRRPGEYDSIIVADRIGPEKTVDIPQGGERPVWVSVKVPSDAAPGVRSLTLKVSAPGMKTERLPLTYTVSDETLPDPSQWPFDLDLWQNPYAVARYFGVPLWSDGHFARMEPLFRRLAAAGQKAVTATVIDRPWNGQTEDPFGSMVVKTLHEDGTWTYDYEVFDKWVEFMFSLGIDRQIKCFTLLPWKLTFDYVDATTGETRYAEGAPGSEAYDGYWTAFIKDFAAHLRAKGWFDRTLLAMDERPHATVRACVEMIRSVEPGFKFSFSGKKYHDDIADDFFDYCVECTSDFPASAPDLRRAGGNVSTFYACCAVRYPNTFLASDPCEGAWFGWYALAHNLDGFHRWSYNSWTKNPTEDARFRRWPAGDCYMVYPEGTGVRFENLVEGLQDYEKARILRDRWTSEGNTRMLDSLDRALSRFSIDEITAHGPREALEAARKVLL